MTLGEVYQKAQVLLLTGSPAILCKESIAAEAKTLVEEGCRNLTGNPLSPLDFYSDLNLEWPQLWPWVEEACKRRLQGESLQYITGVQYFLNHDYLVSPDVLIPRPETEGLVVLAMAHLDRIVRNPKRGMEIGLGSGVISIELLARDSGLEMMASEYSTHAIEIAKKNAQKILGNGIFSYQNRFQILSVRHRKDVFGPFQGKKRVDFIISNPPYLAFESELDPEVFNNEPHLALFAPNEDFLFFYRAIADHACEYLVPGGFVFLEVPHERSNCILDLFHHEKWKCALLKDLNQRSRFLVGEWKGING